MEKKINGYKYIGQYADKYYLTKIYHNADSADVEVYDATKNKLKVLKVRKNETVRINREVISVHNLLNENEQEIIK